MQFISTLLYILLFVICLSILIVIHELGHLIVAKAFKVYCNEFSIGFGPKFFSFKRKRGETYFSLRVIPFGGFVSMADTGMEEIDGVSIPKERQLSGIKKWKRVLIMGAGVTMNALLALFVFFSYECFFPKTQVYAPIVTVETNGVAYNAGLRNLDFIEIGETNLKYVYSLDDNALITYSDDSTRTVKAVIDGSSLFGYDKLQWGYYLHFCTFDADGKITYSQDDEILPANNIKFVSFSIERTHSYDEEEKAMYENPGNLNIVLNCVQDSEGYYVFENIGTSLYSESRYNKNFGETIKNTFVDFGEGSVAIIQGFASMFTTSQGFQSAGGIIAIGVQTTEILQNFGFASYLRIWGLISVNLAIVNLFPFPGLDGWHMLVLAVEGITKKEMPGKVKNIMAFIGMALLFALMILLLFKDVFTYIF